MDYGFACKFTAWYPNWCYTLSNLFLYRLIKNKFTEYSPILFIKNYLLYKPVFPFSHKGINIFIISG